VKSEFLDLVDFRGVAFSEESVISILKSMTNVHPICLTHMTHPIQIKPKSQFEFVLRDTEKPEFLDWLDFRGVAFSVESVVSVGEGGSRLVRLQWFCPSFFLTHRT